MRVRAQAALGLHHAHQAGFVHRDIKPSNIVVAGERHIAGATEPAVAKILDMGLIRSVGLEEGGPDGLDLTRSGTVVGTPDYMAPEQSKNSSTVDHRADLYSLGCTLYYLLAGRPPFPDGNPLEKIIKHQLETPLPLQALRPDVPTPVAEVVARLMAKSPDQRYPTALAAAEALDAVAGLTNAAAPSYRESSRGMVGISSDASPTPERIKSTTPSHPLTAITAPPDHTPQPKSRSKRLRPPAIDTYPLEGLAEPTTDAQPVLTPAPPQPVRRKPVSTAPPSRSRQPWILAIATVLLVLCLSFWLVVALSR